MAPDKNNFTGFLYYFLYYFFLMELPQRHHVFQYPCRVYYLPIQVFLMAENQPKFCTNCLSPFSSKTFVMSFRGTRWFNGISNRLGLGFGRIVLVLNRFSCRLYTNPGRRKTKGWIPIETDFHSRDDTQVMLGKSMHVSQLLSHEFLSNILLLIFIEEKLFLFFYTDT